MAKSRIISAIDIGTSKITTIIASQQKDSDRINVVGVSTTESRGLRKSQIVDIEEAVGAITNSVESAERMAGYSITEAFVSIGGSHIESINSKGVVAVSEPEGEIVVEDINRVVEAARAISLPFSREILHVIPRDFIVDSQEGIKDPLGMTGVRLEVETHIVTGSSTAMRNLAKCVGELGVNVNALVFSGLVAAEAVLTETEKELGVCLVDIGGGTTSIAVFIDGSLAYSSVLPIGAKNVTNDLAIGLRVSLTSAEKIKLELSKIQNKKHRYEDKDEKKEAIDLKKLNIEEEIANTSIKTLTEGIIRPRLNEMFMMIGEELKKSGFGGATPAGIVLSGGGARTAGIVSACKRTLSLPVRVGIPEGLSGLIEEIGQSDFATSQGLILYGIKNTRSSESISYFGNFGKIIGKVPVKGMAKKAIDFVKSFLP